MVCTKLTDSAEASSLSQIMVLITITSSASKVRTSKRAYLYRYMRTMYLQVYIFFLLNRHCSCCMFI